MLIFVKQYPINKIKFTFYVSQAQSCWIFFGFFFTFYLHSNERIQLFFFILDKITLFIDKAYSSDFERKKNPSVCHPSAICKQNLNRQESLYWFYSLFGLNLFRPTSMLLLSDFLLLLIKKVLYEFNYLSVCMFIYIYVTCSRLEQKLSKISKI
jgi:hypothetical protein